MNSNHLQEQPADRDDGNLFKVMDGDATKKGGWLSDSDTTITKSAVKTGLAVAVPAAVDVALAKKWIPNPCGKSW